MPGHEQESRGDAAGDRRRVGDEEEEHDRDEEEEDDAEEVHPPRVDGARSAPAPVAGRPASRAGGLGHQSSKYPSRVRSSTPLASTSMLSGCQAPLCRTRSG